MKTIFTLLFTTLYITVFSYNWIPFGPTDIHANNVLFDAGNNGYSVICTDSGVCLNNGAGYTWNHYNYGLPVWEAIPYDTANVLLVVGNGSLSDGIYKFNLTSNTYNLIQYCYIPTFIRYCTDNNTYYAGTRYNGMWSSSDGITWTEIPYFQSKGCAAIDFYGQHIVVTQENNIYATYYSDDGGITWNQSSSNIPIHDMAFDQNGVLYGIFTGISNSSGLYISHDYGHSWNMEYFIDNINVVGFDVVGNLFTGFHNAVPTFEGVALYDTATNNFTFLNNSLPDKNINRFRINPILSSITIFACTDTGVYFCNNYLTSLPNQSFQDNHLNIYPNPSTDYLNITGTEKGIVEIISLKGQTLKTLRFSDVAVIDISGISPGEYLIKIITGQGIFKKKFIKK